MLPEFFEKLMRILKIRRLRNLLFWFGLWVVFLVGLSARVYMFSEVLYPPYIHDGSDHIKRILITRKTWADPLALLGVEGPQQPLYYWIAAFVIDPTINIKDLSKHGNLAALGLCISSASMSMLFLSLQYLPTWFMRYIILIYFSLTPSLVLASNCIGNDVLLTFFGVLLFYFWLKANRSPQKMFSFWFSFMVLMLGVLSKLGGIALFAIVPFLLHRRYMKDSSIMPTFKRCLIMSLFFGMWLLYTLNHAWVPKKHEFLFAHTGIGWVNQEIHNIYGDYFLTFRLNNILDECQATTIPSTSGMIRFSFFSFQYTNMFLGEYEYNNILFRYYAMWVLLSGLFIPMGLLLFLITIVKKREFFNNSVAVLILLIVAEILAAAFVIKEPVCCSADFRYLFYLVPWIGYAVSKGLSSFLRHRSMKILGSLFIGVYAFSCVNLLVQRLIFHP